MEIKSITIENFQSHTKTVIEPAPAGQLTAMTGQSDTGKTAVIRALRWLFYNIWDDSFMRHGAKFSRVTTEYEDGTKIIRGRSRSGDSNFYDIVPPDGDKVHLTRFRGSVPLEVQLITGVKPVTISDVDINVNIAEQGEPWFLARPVSALARAKVLGKLAGTEEVDMAARTTATDILRRKLEEKKLTGEVRTLETEIEGFSYLPALARRIAELEKIVADIRVARECWQKLFEAQVNLARVRSGKEEIKAIINRWEYVEAAGQAAAAAEKAAVRTRTLRCHKKKLAKARDGIRASAGIIRRWSGLAKAQDETLKASKADAWIRRLVKLGDSYYGARHNVICAMDAIDRWYGLDTAKNEYSTAVSAVVQREPLTRRRELLKQIRTAIGESRKVADRLAGLDEAEVEAKRALIVGAAVASIKILSQELDWVRSAKSEAKAILCRTTRIEKAEELTQNLEAATSKQGKIISLAGRLHQAKTNARLFHESAVMWEQRVSGYEGAYRDELVTLGRCPMCGNDIDIQKLKEVV